MAGGPDPQHASRVISEHPEAFPALHSLSPVPGDPLDRGKWRAADRPCDLLSVAVCALALGLSGREPCAVSEPVSPCCRR